MDRIDDRALNLFALSHLAEGKRFRGRLDVAKLDQLVALEVVAMVDAAIDRFADHIAGRGDVRLQIPVTEAGRQDARDGMGVFRRNPVVGE